MDDLTIKVQMAAQRQLLRSMDVEAERDAAIARAEAAEEELANCRGEIDDDLADCHQILRRDTPAFRHGEG